MVWRGEAVIAWLVLSWLVKAWQGSRCWSRRCSSGVGVSWQSRLGKAKLVMALYGKAVLVCQSTAMMVGERLSRQSWPGWSRPVLLRRGSLGPVGPGLSRRGSLGAVRRGWARLVKAGAAWFVEVWRAEARFVMARRSSQGMVRQGRSRRGGACQGL